MYAYTHRQTHNNTQFYVLVVFLFSFSFRRRLCVVSIIIINNNNDKMINIMLWIRRRGGGVYMYVYTYTHTHRHNRNLFLISLRRWLFLFLSMYLTRYSYQEFVEFISVFETCQHGSIYCMLHLSIDYWKYSFFIFFIVASKLFGILFLINLWTKCHFYIFMFTSYLNPNVSAYWMTFFNSNIVQSWDYSFEYSIMFYYILPAIYVEISAWF